MDGGGVVGTPMKETLEILFEIRADTSTEGAVEIESNTLPTVTGENIGHAVCVLICTSQ